MPSERRRLHVTGRVQGVGFRATTRHLASGFAVRGYVRNLPDGSVEVVAEGEPGELDRFREAIAREFRPNIRALAVEQASNEPALPEGFTVRP